MLTPCSLYANKRLPNSIWSSALPSRKGDRHLLTNENGRSHCAHREEIKYKYRHVQNSMNSLSFPFSII